MSQVLRLVSLAAIILAITMIAYHSASISAATLFHWYVTLFVAIVLCIGKVVATSQAEVFLAYGARPAALGWLAVAVVLVCADASLLYAFRSDSHSNASAVEEAAIERRERVKARLEGLLAEQKHLISQASAAPTAATPKGQNGYSAAIRFAAVPAGGGDCKRIPPPWFRGKPEPTAPSLEVGDDCDAQNAREMTKLALTAAAKRAEAASTLAERAASAAERRQERLAELPGLIKTAEAELLDTKARATSDHGASIVAQGLNWFPAGIAGVFGLEFRPVEGPGVETFWNWAFVFAVEIFAVFGFPAAARSDRYARRRLEMGKIA